MNMDKSKINIYLLDPNEDEDSMRYESLAKCAFNCQRGGGPDGIAEASFYDSNIVGQVNSKGLKALYSIIDELIIKSDNKLKKELIEARDSLSENISYHKAGEFVDYIIKILLDEFGE